MEKVKQKSAEEKLKLKQDKWFATLTVNSEFFGQLGLTHTDSFYQIYVRPDSTSNKWWKFDKTGVPENNDPIKYIHGLSKEEKALNVRGKIKDLLNYKIHPGKKGLALLLEKTKALKA